MLSIIFNWRTALALLAIAIVTGTIFYSRYLTDKIAKEEKNKITQWVEASKAIISNPNMDLTLPNMIRNEQTDIPIIETNEKDSIVNYINLDSSRIEKNSTYLQEKLEEFKKTNEPLVLELNKDPYIANKYYYGNTELYNEVRFFPSVQLLIIGLFIFITITLITVRNKSTENQVWAGMAKETAHQLGTPLSSLNGWVEMLRDNPDNSVIVKELEKDVERLKLISDRFSKIGSKPHLETCNIIQQITQMVDYMRKRATDKVKFTINSHDVSSIPAQISPPLFDWVIENLLKNALDAMEGGVGAIHVDIRETIEDIYIDVADTGKGISHKNLRNIFKPGYTTKKRGWGLGLSLSKRIVEQYHKGSLTVKSSELGKGTTFRISLPRWEL